MLTVDARVVANAVKQVGVTPTLWLWADDTHLWLRSTQAGANDLAGEVGIAHTGDGFDATLVETATLKAAFAGAATDETAVVSRTAEALSVVRPKLTCDLAVMEPCLMVLPAAVERIQESEAQVLVDIPASLLSYVAKASSHNDTQPTIASVLAEADGDGMVRFVATDTYRLHIREWDARCDFDGTANIPIGAIKAALKSRPATVTVRWAGTRFEVSSPDGPAWSQVGSEGVYPKYRKTIAVLTQDGRRVTVQTAELAAALRLLMPVAKRDAYRVSLNEKKKTLGMKALYIGQMTVPLAMTVAGTFGKGVPPVACYNARYLLDALQNERVTAIYASAPLTTAAILQGPSPDELTLTAVVMPMQEL